MSKPQPRRVPSDDCAVVIDGDTYYPHEGEWVELVGSTTVGDFMALANLERVSVELDAARGEPDEALQMLRAMDGYFSQVCDGLARRVTAWTWTDDQSQPLPNPKGNPDAFAALRPDELKYLIGLARGEQAADRKNASAPSRITSSATASRATGGANSITGHNRRRVS